MNRRKKIVIVVLMILTVWLIITTSNSSSNSSDERESQEGELEAGKSWEGESREEVGKSWEGEVGKGEVGKGEVEGEPEVYIMGLRYMGQQAAGIKCLSGLQCWAGELGLLTRVVEPVIKHTEIMYSLMKTNSMEFMELGDYFDMRHLNVMSRSAGYAQIIPRGEYLRKASKSVIFVRSNIVVGTLEEPEWTYSDANPCYMDEDGAILGIKLSRELRESGYCVVEVVVAKAGQLTRQKMVEILVKWRHRSVTVMISRWGPPTVSLSSECKLDRTAHHFHPSTRLLKDARRYRDQHMHSTKYSAVMIRLEHAVMLTERDDKYSIRGCLDEVASSVQKLKGKVDMIPMVAADIGKYGSNTWKWAVKDQRKLSTAVNATRDFIEGLLQHRWSFDEWEGTFVAAAGGVTNEGYIAALQHTIASRAECLVLMGGGSFQDMVLKEYLSLHGPGEWCVTLVCSHYKAKMKAIIEEARKGHK